MVHYKAIDKNNKCISIDLQACIEHESILKQQALHPFDQQENSSKLRSIFPLVLHQPYPHCIRKDIFQVIIKPIQNPII
jgi:hypothetical protein